MTAGGQGRSFNTGVFMKVEDDMALAVNAFLVASRRVEEGFANAEKERRQHLRTLQGRYWNSFFALLSANMTRNHNRIDLNDEERMFVDLGLVDLRMLGGERGEVSRKIVAELRSAGPQGSYYLSEWLWHRQQQFQLEDSVADVAVQEDAGKTSQLVETRKRVLSRLSGYFDGLPGIPREVSESMRSGDLDDAILNLSVALMRKSNRQLLLRRRNLWQLREQVMAKARARVDSQGSLRLFEALNEVYGRDWRERYEMFLNQDEAEPEPPPQQQPQQTEDTASSQFTLSGLVMLEARQMRMRLSLIAAMNGDARPDIVLYSDAPRLTKQGIADFLPVLQSFDRSLIELPPLVIVPGAGRGVFAWETGCILLSVRPAVGPDDSIATAFAYQRMLDDRLNKDGSLRKAYEQAFPGANFNNEFPVDYRSWLCRLTNGDASAMSPERRNFFRDHIGPDITGPMLPVNLRNIGPQTRDIICRRLEKQIAAGENDYKLHRRLAALYWHQGNLDAAGMQFTAAMQLAPNDGETLFTTGMFMRSTDSPEGANTFFRHGAERAANTLWGIYCQDALAGMF